MSIPQAIKNTAAHFVAADAPPEYRANFFHFYLDIAWFGLVTGTAVSFISVYLVRIGASGFQIGLFSAAPAVIALAFTLPTGKWLRGQSIGRAVFWTSVAYRFFYLVWVPLPVLLSPSNQVWIFVALTFLMSIPGTALAVGFNVLFAEAVPVEYRGHVVGVRNALLAITVTLTSLLSGFLLKMLPFPLGFQVLFGIGFIGAAMSSYHLWRIRVSVERAPELKESRSLGDFARPGFMRTVNEVLRPGVGLRYLLRRRTLRFPKVAILQGAYGWVLGGLFLFHFTQHLAIPLFTLYWVDDLHFSDQILSWGNAVFFMLMFLGSTQIGWLTARFGNTRLMIVGSLLLVAYPALTAITQGPGLYFLTAAVGGVAWSVAGGVLGNYLLDRIPEGDQPGHLAWYNLILNAAVLLGSLGGPLIANLVGLRIALMIIAGGRLFSAILIWWINREARFTPVR